MRTVHHMFMTLENIAELLITVHSDFLSRLLTLHFAYNECLKLYYVCTYGTQCSVILNLVSQRKMFKGYFSVVYSSLCKILCMSTVQLQHLHSSGSHATLCSAPLSVFYFINSLCFTTKTVLVTIWKSISTLWKYVSYTQKES